MIIEESGENPGDVGIDDGAGQIEGETGNGPRGVATETRQGGKNDRIPRELTAVVVQDRPGGFLKVADPAVVAKTFPGPEELPFGGRGEGFEVGKGGEKLLEPAVLADRRDGGLLEHDLGNEDRIRIGGPAPWMLGAVGGKPAEQGVDEGTLVAERMLAGSRFGHDEPPICGGPILGKRGGRASRRVSTIKGLTLSTIKGLTLFFGDLRQGDLRGTAGFVTPARMALTTYTVEIPRAAVETLRTILGRDGFDFSEKPYAHYSAKKGKLNVTVYEKGPKVLVQGKDTEDFVRFTLEPEVLGEARLGYEEVTQPEMFEPHFGIDESGKGDFFGPLVIGGAYVDGESARVLLDAGVMDSKRIGSSAKIKQLAAAIRRVPGMKWSVVAIGPERYNEMYGSFRNLNELLAWGHATVIGELAGKVPGCPRALSDQFANPRVLKRALTRQGVGIVLEQKTKGESDVAVAAASILARERFLAWMEEAAGKWGMELPLGAGPRVLDAGGRFLAQFGDGEIAKVAKTHFKTLEQITS